MEVHLKPDVQANLSRLATQQGRDAEALVEEAVERLLDYEDWFLRQVDKGLAAADRGQFVEHANSLIAAIPANACSLDSRPRPTLRMRV